MADENDCCDLAVAYWYFLCNSESMNKRKRRKKQEWWFWIHDVISRRDDHRLVHAAASWSWTFSTVFSNVNVAVRYVAIAKPDTNWRRSIWPADSVGYDTSKLYRDTDTWYIYQNVSWYWYILKVSWFLILYWYFWKPQQVPKLKLWTYVVKKTQKYKYNNKATSHTVCIKK